MRLPCTNCSKIAFRRKTECSDRLQRLCSSDLDLNEDAALSEDEVSSHLWNRLIGADTNDDQAVTIEELDAARTSREIGVQMPEPDEAFAMLDVNDDSQLTSDEVSAAVWRNFPPMTPTQILELPLTSLRQVVDAAREVFRTPTQKNNSYA